MGATKIAAVQKFMGKSKELTPMQGFQKSYWQKRQDLSLIRAARQIGHHFPKKSLESEAMLFFLSKYIYVFSVVIRTPCNDYTMV